MKKTLLLGFVLVIICITILFCGSCADFKITPEEANAKLEYDFSTFPVEDESLGTRVALPETTDLDSHVLTLHAEKDKVVDIQYDYEIFAQCNSNGMIGSSGKATVSLFDCDGKVIANHEVNTTPRGNLEKGKKMVTVPLKGCQKCKIKWKAKVSINDVRMDTSGNISLRSKIGITVIN